MVFSTVKKHKDQKEVQEHLKSFQDSFSDEQKKCVICSLFLVANIDGEYHQKEKDFFQETADVLGYRMQGDINEQVKEFLSIDRNDLFETLKSLSKEQKDWFIATVLSMIHADGEALDKEVHYADEFFEKMGITHAQCEEVIKNSPTLQALA